MSGDQSSSKTSLKDLKETFDFFDSDDSQTITRQELEYVVLLMGGSTTKDNLDELMNMLDVKDRDGKVEWTEFETAWNDPKVRERFQKETKNSHVWPTADVGEKDGRIIVRMDVPGLKSDSLMMQFHGTCLLITGEREIKKMEVYHSQERFDGKFARLIDIPKPVKKKTLRAKVKNGILTIKIKVKADQPAASVILVEFRHKNNTENNNNTNENKGDTNNTTESKEQ
jgi:HSP20 family molecular chaperone IbpA